MIQSAKANILYAAERENHFNRNFIIDKPDGWIIMDTVNNPFFSIDILPYDTREFDLGKIKKEFHRKYGGKPNDLFLPWHYTIDLINETPYVINTRPFNYKTFIEGYEKHLIILLIGDSNQDVYPEIYYRTIADFIINPFKLLHGFYIYNNPSDFIFYTGKNFKKDILMKFIQ